VRNGASLISSELPKPCPDEPVYGLSTPSVFGSFQNSRRGIAALYVLIGGQAVNHLAQRYLAIEPQLKPLQPFTSADLISKSVVMMSNALPDGSTVATDSGLSINRPNDRIDSEDSFPNRRLGNPTFNLSGRFPEFQVRWTPGTYGGVERESHQCDRSRFFSGVQTGPNCDGSAGKATGYGTLENSTVLRSGVFLQQVECGELPASHWLGTADQVL
jgi:hypothetical protein